MRETGFSSVAAGKLLEILAEPSWDAVATLSDPIPIDVTI